MAKVNNMWDVLDEDFHKRTIPDGTFCIPDYAKRYDISEPQARGIVNRLEKAGKIEFVGRFGSRNAKYYRLK